MSDMVTEGMITAVGVKLLVASCNVLITAIIIQWKALTYLLS